MDSTLDCESSTDGIVVGMAISDTGAVSAATSVIDVDRVNNTAQMGDASGSAYSLDGTIHTQGDITSDLYNANLDSLLISQNLCNLRTQDTRMVVIIKVLLLIF